MAVVKLHSLVLFLLASVGFAEASTGLRRRRAFFNRENNPVKNDASVAVARAEAKPIEKQPPSNWMPTFDSIRPSRSRTLISDSTDSSSSKNFNLFDMVPSFSMPKFFDIDALQREEEAKTAQLERKADEQKEIPASHVIEDSAIHENERATDQESLERIGIEDIQVTATNDIEKHEEADETDMPLAFALPKLGSKASFSSASDDDDEDDELSEMSNGNELLASSASIELKEEDFEYFKDFENVSAGFTKIMSNWLEDDFHEVQEAMEKLEDDKMKSTEATEDVGGDFVLVEKVDSEVREILFKSSTFNFLMSKFEETREAVALVNQVQKLLVKIVKKIFYNVPPVNSAFPAPNRRHVNDFQLAEDLLLPAGVYRGGRDNFLQITTREGKVLIASDSMLPRASSFAAARQYLASRDPEQFKVIDIDIRRLPPLFIHMNRALKEERLSQTALMDEPKEEMSLLARTAYVLFYVLTAETGLSADFHYFQYSEFLSKELPENEDGFLDTAEIPLRYSYTQGFTQIAAYFAAKFDLRLAGPLTLRFFERFMPQVLTITNTNMGSVYKEIENEALFLVRKFLEDRDKLTVQIERILEGLEKIPFGGTCISVLHFTAAPSHVELEELVQFLLTGIPLRVADSAIAIILAARLLYAMTSFLTQLEPFNKNFPENFEEFESSLFIETFEHFGPKAVFRGEEMKFLLDIARELAEIMIEDKDLIDS